MFSLKVLSRLAYLVSVTKALSHITLTPFSNLVGDKAEKAIATTLLKYPKTDFRIAKSELQSM